MHSIVQSIWNFKGLVKKNSTVLTAAIKERPDSLWPFRNLSRTQTCPFLPPPDEDIGARPPQRSTGARRTTKSLGRWQSSGTLWAGGFGTYYSVNVLPSLLPSSSAKSKSIIFPFYTHFPSFFLIFVPPPLVPLHSRKRGGGVERTLIPHILDPKEKKERKTFPCPKKLEKKSNAKNFEECIIFLRTTIFPVESCLKWHTSYS